MTSSNQVEDIFSDQPEVQPEVAVSSEPTASPIEPSVIPQRSYRRLILIIASCLLALLLLGGIGFGVWVWLQTPPDDGANLSNDNVNVVVPVVNTNTNDPVVVTPTNTAVDATPTFVDVDHDGLSDGEELIVNTNPKKKDTDEDGLSDREEVRVYDTDPRNPDTDGDGYTDGDEVAHFYHPNSLDPKKRLFDLPQ